MFIRIVSQPFKGPVQKAVQGLEQAANTQTPAKLTETLGSAAAPQKVLTVRNVKLAGGAAIAGLAVLECYGVIPRTLILPAFDALKSSGLPERASALAGQCLTRGSNLAKESRDVLLGRWNENRFKWITNQMEEKCGQVVEARKALAEHLETSGYLWNTNGWYAKSNALQAAQKFAEQRCEMAGGLPNPFASASPVVTSKPSIVTGLWQSSFFSGLRDMNALYSFGERTVKCGKYCINPVLGVMGKFFNYMSKRRP
jgi:hypothetical protein